MYFSPTASSALLRAFVVSRSDTKEIMRQTAEVGHSSLESHGVGQPWTNAEVKYCFDQYLSAVPTLSCLVVQVVFQFCFLFAVFHVLQLFSCSVVFTCSMVYDGFLCVFLFAVSVFQFALLRCAAV